MLDPYYEICAQRALPVLVHIGPTSPALSFEKTAPFDVDSAARRFPNVRFVLAHGAVAYVEEATMMCRYRPNVFLDISGFQGRRSAASGTPAGWHLSQDLVRDRLAHLPHPRHPTRLRDELRGLVGAPPE
jgi:predicted TIM-barrel fold metal-dependent hydrolase